MNWIITIHESFNNIKSIQMLTYNIAKQEKNINKPYMLTLEDSIITSATLKVYIDLVQEIRLII